MGREEGGGFRRRNTCKVKADSCQCMEKPLQYFKVISLQLIKIIGKKRKSVLNIHGKVDAETEAPIFSPPDTKSQLIGKDPDAGKDSRQEEK